MGKFKVGDKVRCILIKSIPSGNIKGRGFRLGDEYTVTDVQTCVNTVGIKVAEVTAISENIYWVEHAFEKVIEARQSDFVEYKATVSAPELLEIKKIQLA